MIEFQHVTKLYKSVIGVNDVTVSLPVGAYGLLGPNGSGKSTLLNLITGQLRPTLGHVQTLGLSPWNNLEMRRQIGVCPEHDLSYANVVAVDWLTYLLKLNGFGRRESRRRAEQAFDQVQTQRCHGATDGHLFAWHAPESQVGTSLCPRSRFIDP